MKNAWVNPWFAAPALAFLLVGVFFAVFVPYGEEILYFNSWRAGWLNPFFRWATHLGEVMAYVIAGLALLFWRYRFALLVAVTGLLTMPLVYTLKDQLGHDRPLTYFEKSGLRSALVVVPDEELNSGRTSFPSGHTMGAFGLYGLLSLLLSARARRWGLLFAFLAILTGFSRIFLVQHFLPDVLAGAALGLSLSWLVWQLDQLPFMRRARFLDRSLLRKSKMPSTSSG